MKEFLSRRGIEFEEIDVATDPKARQEFVKKGYMGVPITIIGNREIMGFDPPKLEEAIACQMSE